MYGLLIPSPIHLFDMLVAKCQEDLQEMQQCCCVARHDDKVHKLVSSRALVMSHKAQLSKVLVEALQAKQDCDTLARELAAARRQNSDLARQLPSVTLDHHRSFILCDRGAQYYCWPAVCDR